MSGMAKQPRRECMQLFVRRSSAKAAPLSSSPRQRFWEMTQFTIAGSKSKFDERFSETLF